MPPVFAALLAAILVALLTSVSPRFGALLVAILVFVMLSSGIRKGNIEL